MSKILEKFGIYDLIAVLLPGICINTFSLLILEFVYHIPHSIEIPINETLAFLVISYFGGLLFQECGSFIQRNFTNKDNKILEKVINPPVDFRASAENSRMSLTNKEWDGIREYVRNKLLLETSTNKRTKETGSNDNNLIWNYCKLQVQGKYDTARMDKDQSLIAMSRSLFLYFLIVAILTLATCVINFNLIRFLTMLMSVAFSVLLYYRCERLARLRYTYVFQVFYYHKVIQCESRVEHHQQE